jgi:hypothetical protein
MLRASARPSMRMVVRCLRLSSGAMNLDAVLARDDVHCMDSVVEPGHRRAGASHRPENISTDINAAPKVPQGRKKGHATPRMPCASFFMGYVPIGCAPW